MAESTLTVCGLASVLAVAKSTPALIERLFFSDERAPLFADACRYLASQRKTYRLVTTDELRKITDTTHHQGAAAVIQLPAESPLVDRQIGQASLCLHDVVNPHNVGAIARTAAFFGFESLAVSRKTYNAAMTAAAWRVAEGGCTHVTFAVYETADDFFRWSEKMAVRPIAAIRPDSKTTRTLREFLRDKTNAAAMVCVGNEEDGLSDAFVSRCAGRFSIQGSGKIESLNVSVTAALCLEKLSALHAGTRPA